MRSNHVVASGVSFRVLAFGMALFVLGCASSEVSIQPAAPGAVAPERGGAFHITTRQRAQHLNEKLTSGGLGTSITVGPIYDTILSFDYRPDADFRNEYAIRGNLAERWEQPTPTTYVFHLRKNVKFHDGTPMTADDVVSSLEWIRNPANKFGAAVSLRDVTTIEKLDNYTVRINMKAPLAPFIQEIADRGLTIRSKTLIDKGETFEKIAVGTGPFKIQSWDPQSGAVLVRNEEYWEDGKPYLDKIQMFYAVDAAGSIAAFAAKKDDVVKVSDKAQYDSIKAVNPQVKGETFPQNIEDSLYVQLDRSPFNDLRVRRAMHLAVDRQAMIDTITFGLGNANPPGMNGARKGWSIPQEELLKLPGYRQPKDADMTEARRLLAEAGYPNGFRTEVLFSATHTRTPGESEVLARQMNTVGIQMTLKPVEDAVYQISRRDGTFETLMTSSTNYLPESAWGDYFHSKGPGNSTKIQDPELDRLIDAQLVEMDVEKRKKQWIDIQRLLLERLYVIPTITQVGFLGFQPYVNGWVDNRAGQAVNLAWEQTWLKASDVPAGR